MAVTIDTQRTEFYKELPPEKREPFLGLKRMKILPTIDNLYFSIFVYGDGKTDNRLAPLLEKLDEKKAEAFTGSAHRGENHAGRVQKGRGFAGGLRLFGGKMPRKPGGLLLSHERHFQPE